MTTTTSDEDSCGLPAGFAGEKGDFLKLAMTTFRLWLLICSFCGSFLADLLLPSFNAGCRPSPKKAAGHRSPTFYLLSVKSRSRREQALIVRQASYYDSKAHPRPFKPLTKKRRSQRQSNSDTRSSEYLSSMKAETTVDPGLKQPQCNSLLDYDANSSINCCCPK